MIDAGIAERRLRKLTQQYGMTLGKVAAVLVTHHHIDHVRALAGLNQKENIPVYMTEETKKGIFINRHITKKPRLEDITTFYWGNTFRLLDMNITPFSVPHDSRDNSGFLITHDSVRLCIVTDCGHWTDEIESHVSQATHLVLESNYDPLMLARGPYPLILQDRIRGRRGNSPPLSTSQDHLAMPPQREEQQARAGPRLSYASPRQWSRHHSGSRSREAIKTIQSGRTHTILISKL